MIVKKIKYKDWKDVEREEEFRFNMTEAELAEMQLSVNGGMEALVRQIVNTRDNARLVRIFKDLVLQSYGEISVDGRLFQKSPELSKAFSETPAYSILFMELATDADKAAEFLRGIMPEKMQKNATIDMAAAEKELNKPTQPNLLNSVAGMGG